MSQLRLRASPPAVPAGLVRRPRLQDELDRGAAGPVTLVSAGPGTGKTLAVASWLRDNRFDNAAAWLTVDGTHNDLPRLWADVLGAMALGGALPAASPLRDLVPATRFGPPQALQVRAGLADLPVPVLLVLDDLQEISDLSVLESLNELIDHQPPNLRLLLITRSDPALRLHRVRVNGNLTEIRSQDLSFTEPEATELFSRSGLELTAEQVRLLLDRTQGWPAGLRLAAMSLARTDAAEGIARFTGTERSVADYLIGEVLDRLPPEDRTFLVTTSIADRITPSLATALTGRADSHQLLQSWVTANAFVVRVGGPEDWFRCHPLLRELLEYRLAVEFPQSVGPLHLRAARWFTEHGEPIPALQHLTLTGAWDELGRLLTGTALPLILTPAGPALAAALKPAAVHSTSNPSLGTLLAAGVCHFQSHDFAGMLRDAESAAEFLPDAADEVRIPAEILIAIMELTYDRTTAGALVASSTKLLSLLDRAPRRLVPATPHYRAIGLNNLGVGLLWDGALADARDRLTEAEERARELGMGLAVLTAGAHLSLLDVIHGRLRSADRTARSGRDVVDRRGWAAEPQALCLSVSLGLTLLAWNRLGEANDIITAGLAASSTGSDTACRLALGIAAVGVAIARHDALAARTAASRLEAELKETVNPPEMLARWCAVARAQAWLSAGDADTAMSCLPCTTDDTGYPDALERIVRAKAYLAVGRANLLPELLAPVLTSGVPYLGPAVEARVLLAVAAELRHQDSSALTYITEAIDLAEQEGFLQPFLEAGPAAAALISRHRRIIATHTGFTEQLLPADPVVGAPSVLLLPERLTERELIVLRYLPTMLKPAEIATDLYVSVNTVKSHQRSIYRKLDVETRRAAVERARAMNLL